MPSHSAGQPFRRRILDGERLFGTFLKTPTTHAAEILAQVGYDFVVVDEEHAPFNPETTERIMLACHHAGIAGVVRVADTGQILRVLDSGASGVMAPHVDSAARARQVAAAARYAGGARGFSNTTRAGGFGSVGRQDHVAAQDESTAVLAMIEDPHAIDVIDEVAGVGGIDAFFIGRGDLTVAFGAGKPAAEEVGAAVEAITQAAAQADRRVFVLSASPEDAVELSGKGATGFLMASDQGFLRQGATAALKTFSTALDGK